jgi:hypothetical protein
VPEAAVAVPAVAAAVGVPLAAAERVAAAEEDGDE